MGPKRKVDNLKLKSVWEECLIENVLVNDKKRSKIWNWLINHPEQGLEDSFLEDFSVPRAAIKSLREDFVLHTTTVIEKVVSERGDAIKLLIELQDGHRVETVVMKHHKHATVCVSSQIGCQMGCKFCATGTMGIIGDLTAGEILEQLVHANNVTKIRNVVFMGMGEPLNNYDNVLRAVQFMVDERRFALSPRQVTVSTVGVLRNMYRLTLDMPYVNLALSLHASNQEVREKIVPAAKFHHFGKLMDALDNHILYSCNPETGRRNGILKPLSVGAVEYKSEEKNSDTTATVTINTEPKAHKYWENFGRGRNKAKTTTVMIEYILIKDINVYPEHAHELGALLMSRREHILLNLIPYNPTTVAEDFYPPSKDEIDAFYQILLSEPYQIHTRVRHEKGQDIDGACGQLALVSKAEKAAALAAAAAAKAEASIPEIEDGVGVKRKERPAPNKRISGSSRKSSSDSSMSSGLGLWSGSLFDGLKGYNRTNALCAMNLAVVAILALGSRVSVRLG